MSSGDNKTSEEVVQQHFQKVEACLNVIIQQVFKWDYKRISRYINQPNPMTKSTALLECALRYCKSVERSVASKKPDEVMHVDADYFFRLLMYFIKQVNASVNDRDAENCTLLHYLLRPIPAVKRSGSSMLTEVLTSTLFRLSTKLTRPLLHVGALHNLLCRR